jgi:hypothetical protein
MNTRTDDLTRLQKSLSGLCGADIVGEPLRFVKGDWIIGVKGDEAKVDATSPFIVDVWSFQHGWIRWWDQQPTHTIMGRPIDGYPFPLREKLPDQDKSKWQLDQSGQPKDPWQETFRIVMKDTEAVSAGDDGLCTWTVTSWGGRKKLRGFFDAFVREGGKRPDIMECGLMPVVLLRAEVRGGTYGPVAKPVLTITDWQEFGEGASPPGGSMAPPLLPAQPMKPVADSNEAKAEEPKVPVKTLADEMDDEMPF